jgi:hypothetical protein
LGMLSATDWQSAWPWQSYVSWLQRVRDTGSNRRDYISIVPEKDLAILADASNRKMTCFARGRTRLERAAVRLRPLQWAFS